MSQEKGEQILTRTDLEILKFLKNKKKPSTKTSIYTKFQTKKPHRLKDRVNKLIDCDLIKECDGKKQGHKCWEVNQNEKDFIDELILKFKKK